MGLGKVYLVSNMSDIWKFRNRFWYQLKKMFMIIYQYFWSYGTILQKLRQL